MTAESPARQVRLLDAGDCALTVELGDQINAALVARVAALDRAVQVAIANGQLPGVVETMPTFRSLTVLYDPLQTSQLALAPTLLALAANSADIQASPTRRWHLPVCYGGEHGVDLADVAAATNLTPEAVVQLHSSATFTVYMIGFMPGFPFMGDLPAPLRLPRRREPRLRVPKGSVSVAGGLTAIYPWQSPGGWHLIGRCPAPLFDATAAHPALLAAGDTVCFESVSATQLAEIEQALAQGTLSPQSWLEAAATSG